MLLTLSFKFLLLLLLGLLSSRSIHSLFILRYIYNAATEADVDGGHVCMHGGSCFTAAAAIAVILHIDDDGANIRGNEAVVISAWPLYCAKGLPRPVIVPQQPFTHVFTHSCSSCYHHDDNHNNKTYCFPSSSSS